MSQIERKVELLSPAGTLKSQHYAMAFGADAVYAGLPRYSLRVRNNDFNIDNLSVGIDAAHCTGKAVFRRCQHYASWQQAEDFPC